MSSGKALNIRHTNLRGITREYLLAVYLTIERFRINESVISKGEGSTANILLMDLPYDRQNFDEVFPTLTVEGECSIKSFLDELSETFTRLKIYLETELNR